MKTLSLADIATQWQVSVPAAIARLTEADASAFCLVSTDLVSVESGKSASRVKAKCKIDSMDWTRLGNADEITVSVLSLLLTSKAARYAFVRIAHADGCHSYLQYPEPAEMKLTASKVLFDPAAVPAPSEAIKPVSRFAAQEAAIIDEIRRQGHDPRALPKFPDGKPGMRAAICEKLFPSRKDVFMSKGVFYDAWQRLRDDEKIGDVTS